MIVPAPSPSSGSPEPVPAEAALLSACLLSSSGGFLDAFTYVGHGQVFANSMTGNVVLLGSFLALGEPARALRHVPPLAAFFVGVFLARALRHYARRAAVAGLGLEIGVLAAACFLPRGFPDLVLVLAIAFVAALQNSGFNRLEGWSYNSVITTANLRRCAETLFEGVAAHRNPFALREARVFGTVCSCFLAGAFAGAFLTPRWGNLALAVPVFLLAVVLARLFAGLKLPMAGRGG